MKRIFITLVLAGIYTMVFCQSYNMGSASFVSTCSGTFYDNGGAAGDYTNGFKDTITFQSGNNKSISLLFTSINLIAGDNLYLYYGNNAIGAPDITNPSPGLIRSNCCCITIVFSSDTIAVGTGWVATISCSNPPVINDYPALAITPPLDGSFLTGQTNAGATADFSDGCFTAGNTVWYGFSLSGGMNTIDITMQNASFLNAQYLLMYNYSCAAGTSVIAGSQCLPSSGIAHWTNLTQGYYWLGIASVVPGTFDLSISESYIDYCGDFFCGSGESCLTCPYDCGICPEPDGGPYFHAIAGMQNTKLGSCLVSTNSGSYYDNGGSGNTYAANVDQVFRTFCPTSEGMAIRATVTTMSVEYAGLVCKDQLIVRNGPSENSPVIWCGCGNLPVVRTLSGNYNSGIFQSTDNSGCLTFAFKSDLSNTGYWEGWEFQLSEVPFAGGPALTYNNDCVRAIPLCNDFTVSSQMYGPGIVSEGCGSCVLEENYSEWYKVLVSSSGTMEFEIKPLGNSDMDFAVYQADSCGDISTPIRCSHARYEPPGKTGLSKMYGDIAEDINGNQWVSEMKIEKDKTYYIMINELNKNNPNSYTLDFILSDGASFDCSIVLPVTFLDFSVNVKKSAVELIWKTASETNNDYFTIERSTDGIDFEPLATMNGSGNSNEIVHYYFMDENPIQGLAYYRIKQTDFDGNFDYSQVLPVDFLDQKLPWVNVYPSPASEFIHISTDETSLNEQYTICNALGEIVETGICQKSEFTVSIADLDEGLYFFTINNKKKINFLITH